MADRVMVVHHEREFAKRLTTALRHEGHDVTTYQDPMHALEALAAPQRVAVLVLPMQFPPGKPNGLALALQALHKRPEIKVLFCDPPTGDEVVTDLGQFLPAPINVPNVAAAVARLLQVDG